MMSDLKLKVIGVVGTAKNTGKTTTIVALMEEGVRRGLKVGLTGIGYDGEEIDNITLLPKPRLKVVKGSILATSEQCLQAAQAKGKIIEHTQESTPLGEVLIVEVTEPGLIVLAGPNKRRPLEKILQMLKEKTDFILVDGAMNRMVPLMATEGLIFATGAARTTNLSKLAEEMRAIYDIFTYSKGDIGSNSGDIAENIVITTKGTKRHLGISSVLDETDAELLIKELRKGAKEMVIPGIVAQEPLERIIKHLLRRAKKLRFVFSNPTSLLVAGEPLTVKKHLDYLANHNITISYIRNLPILAVTINPFYPKPGKRRGEFQPAFLDADKIHHVFKKLLPIPAVDIQKEGADKLFNICFAQSQKS